VREIERGKKREREREWMRQRRFLWSYIILRGNSLISYFYQELEVKWDFMHLGSGRRVAALVKTEPSCNQTRISEWKCMKVWYISKNNKKVMMIKVIVTNLPLERIFLLTSPSCLNFSSGCLFRFFHVFCEMPKIFLLTIILKFFI